MQLCCKDTKTKRGNPSTSSDWHGEGKSCPIVTARLTMNNNVRASAPNSKSCLTCHLAINNVNILVFRL